MKEKVAARRKTVSTTQKVNVAVCEGRATSVALQQQKYLECSLETNVLKQ